MEVLKWYSTYDHPDHLNFIIEHDENVGYYIYLYENFECFEDDLKVYEGCPSHQDDDLQDTLESAKRVTFKNFGVPVDSWVEVAPPLVQQE